MEVTAVLRSDIKWQQIRDDAIDFSHLDPENNS